MKRRLFLMSLVAIMGLSLIGCSFDDDPTSGKSIDKKILGTWVRVAYYDADSDFTLTLDGGFGETVTFSENNTLMEWGKWRYQKR